MCRRKAVQPFYIHVVHFYHLTLNKPVPQLIQIKEFSDRIFYVFLFLNKYFKGSMVIQMYVYT